MDVDDTRINKIVKHEVVEQLLKSYFKRINKTSILNLARLLLTSTNTDILVTSFIARPKAFIEKNKIKLKSIIIDGKKEYQINPEIVNIIRKRLWDTLSTIGFITEVDDDDNEDKWDKSQVDGVDIYEVGENTVFQDIREKVNKEGKSCNFRFPFKDSKITVDKYKNKMTLQMVEIYVNTNGEYFGFPLKYVYQCPECMGISEKYEFEVASCKRKIKCPTMLEVEKDNGEITFKRCNQPLEPDINRTDTKDTFIYGVTFIDENNQEVKADAISFMPLTKGPLKVVMQKISRPYGKELVFVVDYEPIKKEMLQLPEQTKDEHYIFTLVKQVDQYIKDVTGYTHYGYMHAKVMMLLQMVARYIPQFKNNFNIALIGEMSSGKSAFAKYWGVALYSESIWQSVATSISIPKLRGTMEKFMLFDKEYRYQAKGLLGEVDLLVIDELKEEPNVKNNLKQYLLENNYDYSKQGSNNQTFIRTAHALITENVDTIHLDKYAKEIKKLYQSDTLKLISDEDSKKDMKKSAWDHDWDLTLPLHAYDFNPYLRYSIKSLRDEYTRNQKNWIDGSEIALKQRFYYYLFLGSEKSSEELKKVIKTNSVTSIVSDNIELIRMLSSKNLKEHIISLQNLFDGRNDLEYFNKVDELLKQYGKRTDPRTSEMSYAVLKMIRIIDNRDYCTEKDLEILQYIIESIDNKIEVADTNDFKINGPKFVSDDVIEEDDMSTNNLINTKTDNNGNIKTEEFGFFDGEEF